MTVWRGPSRPQGGRRPVYVDAAPLVSAVARRGIAPETFGARLARAFYRAKATGRVCVPMADELAIRMLGCHLLTLWPEAYDLDAVEQVAS